MRLIVPPKHLLRADLALFRRVARSNVPVLDRALPALSRAANHSVLWMLTAGCLASLGGRFGKRAAARGLGSIAITSALVSGGVKQVVRRPRPSLAGVPGARQLARQPLTTSFPSGHAASAAAFAVGAGSELPVLAPALAAVAAAVAFSRVYIGVHYPADVLVGAGIGSGVALLSRVPWPTVPAEARPPAPCAAPRELPPGGDGEGLALVVNRDAGPAFRAAPLDDIRARLPRARVVEVDEGGRLDEVLDAVAADCEVLGICGGDGSANAAAEVALARGKPLLLVPAGTLNHLARDLGVRSPEDALTAYAGGEAAEVDVGVIDGRPFLNTASFGAYTEMVDRRRDLEATIGRWPAHVVGVARALRAGRPLDVRVDGRDRRLWMVFVGNCRHEPPGFAPSWRPRLDDGLLDVRLVAGEAPLARVRLILGVLTGRLTESVAYEQWEAPRLSIESPHCPLRLGRDGETFDGRGTFTVEKWPERLVVYARGPDGPVARPACGA